MKNFGHPDPKISSNHATAVAAIRPASGMHSRFIEAQVPTPPTMTLRRDALPASPSNARLSRALRLRIAFRNALLVSSKENLYSPPMAGVDASQVLESMFLY